MAFRTVVTPATEGRRQAGALVALRSVVMPARRPSDALLERVRGGYLEMPGLRLTRPQVQRLFMLDSALCDAVLDALVESAFLARTADGLYVRRAQDRDADVIARWGATER